MPARLRGAVARVTLGSILSLRRLCSVASDPVGESPALVLELHTVVELDALFSDDCNRILVHTPSIPVEENLHTLLDLFHGLFFRHVLHRCLVWQ